MGRNIPSNVMRNQNPKGIQMWAWTTSVQKPRKKQSVARQVFTGRGMGTRMLKGPSNFRLSTEFQAFFNFPSKESKRCWTAKTICTASDNGA